MDFLSSALEIITESVSVPGKTDSPHLCFLFPPMVLRIEDHSNPSHHLIHIFRLISLIPIKVCPIPGNIIQFNWAWMVLKVYFCLSFYKSIIPLLTTTSSFTSFMAYLPLYFLITAFFSSFLIVFFSYSCINIIGLV